MGKNQVPRGVTRKKNCRKCGRLYHPILIGSSMQTTKECSVCNPKAYKPQKK